MHRRPLKLTTSSVAHHAGSELWLRAEMRLHHMVEPLR